MIMIIRISSVPECNIVASNGIFMKRIVADCNVCTSLLGGRHDQRGVIPEQGILTNCYIVFSPIIVV
jgi:hypothetical protein